MPQRRSAGLAAPTARGECRGRRHAVCIGRGRLHAAPPAGRGTSRAARRPAPCRGQRAQGTPAGCEHDEWYASCSFADASRTTDQYHAHASQPSDSLGTRVARYGRRRSLPRRTEAAQPGDGCMTRLAPTPRPSPSSSSRTVPRLRARRDRGSSPTNRRFDDVRRAAGEGPVETISVTAAIGRRAFFDRPGWSIHTCDVAIPGACDPPALPALEGSVHDADGHVVPTSALHGDGPTSALLLSEVRTSS